MKALFGYLAILTLVLSAASAMSIAERSSVLAVPAVWPMRSDLAKLDAVVKVHWRDDQPVAIDVWSVGGRDYVEADLMIRDEAGREVATWTLLSKHRPPCNATRRLSSGDRAAFVLSCDGTVEFKRPGRYCAVGTFYSTSKDDVLVRFRSQECWFQVLPEHQKEPNQPAQPTRPAVRSRTTEFHSNPRAHSGPRG